MRGHLEPLEEEDITVTFWRQAMIAIRGHLRESEVFEKVQGSAKGPKTSTQFLASLESLATIYVAIFNPQHEKWNQYPDQIRRAIETLNLLNIRTMRQRNPLRMRGILFIRARLQQREHSRRH
jgi:hypothetical protein